MNEQELAERRAWLERVVAIAKDAGQLLMTGYRSPGAVTKKRATDLVTEFDLRSERLVRERLSDAFPNHSVVGEEGGGDVKTPLVWYCDPLDGTTNFAHGLFTFVVSLGLADRGEPILGVVHAPALGITWAGGVGLGVTRNGAKCSVTRTEELGDALVATGFPYEVARLEDDNLREFTRIVKRARGVRRLGSAALDLALVADGTYDAYWEQTLKPWDLCAGAALVRGAGGRVTNYAGDAVTVEEHRILATNGALHPVLMSELGAARTFFAPS